jgi:hypothetical protein
VYTYEGRNCGVEDFEPINTIAGRCMLHIQQANLQQASTYGTGNWSKTWIAASAITRISALFPGKIHNPDELPRPGSEGIAVGLNSTVYIGMRQVDSVDKTQFSSRYQCREDMTVNSDLTFPNFTTYSQSSCLSQCGYEFIADQCGCIEPQLYTQREGSQ